MPSSRSIHPPRPGLFGAGVGLRIGCAAAVVVLLWIAAAWAVAALPHPPVDARADGPATMPRQ